MKFEDYLMEKSQESQKRQDLEKEVSKFFNLQSIIWVGYWFSKIHRYSSLFVIMSLIKCINQKTKEKKKEETKTLVYSSGLSALSEVHLNNFSLFFPP